MRQMILPFQFSLALLLLLCACGNESEEVSLRLRILDESLAVASVKTTFDNELILEALQEKLADPVTHYKATIWHPKAVQIHKIGVETIQHIESLKKRDLQQNMLSQMESDALVKAISSFKKKVWAVDSLLQQTFSGSTLLPKRFDSLLTDKPDLLIKAFSNSSYNESQVLLAALLNNVKFAENELLRFCLEQCPNNAFICTFYSPIVGQSSNYVKAGEEITITSGVGYFRSTPHQKVTIDGRNAPFADDGLAYYTFKASNNPGKHSLPVRVEYMDQDGKIQIVSKSLEYTVAKE